MTGVGFTLLKVLAVVSGDARVVSEGIHSLGFVFGWLVYFLIGKPTDLQRRREGEKTDFPSTLQVGAVA